MTLNDARRSVIKVIGDCGGVPRTQRLQDICDALNAEPGGGPAPDAASLHFFDTSDMEDFFAKPFTAGQCVADGIFAVVPDHSVPPPPVPTLSSMTAFYTLYVFTDGGKR